jgi:hypothetical protein
MNLIEKTEELIDDIFNFPRTFCAWIVFHAASWLDMKVIPNDEEESIEDYIWDAVQEGMGEDEEDEKD